MYLRDNGDGIVLIPDDGSINTAIATPALGFGGWFFFTN